MSSLEMGDDETSHYPCIRTVSIVHVADWTNEMAKKKDAQLPVSAD